MDTDRLLSDNTKPVPPYQYGASQPAAGIPNEEVHENANQTQPVATAPPITSMERVTGYDNMQFNNCENKRRYSLNEIKILLSQMHIHHLQRMKTL